MPALVVLWFCGSVIRGFGGSGWFGGLEDVGEFSVGFVVGGRFPGGLRFSFFSSLLFPSFFLSLPLSGAACRGLRAKTGMSSSCSIIN